MELACILGLIGLAVCQALVIGWLVCVLSIEPRNDEKPTDAAADCRESVTEEELRRAKEMDEGVDNLMRFQVGGEGPLYSGKSL